MGSERWRRSGARAVSMLAACGALLGASAARAQPTAVERETARGLMKDGDAKLAARDLEGARKAYEAAHAIMRAPSTGLALAKAQMALGLLVEARDVLVQITRTTPAPGEPAAFTSARAEAKELSAKLEPRLAWLAVRVEGPPTGADLHVKLDDLTLPSAALDAPVRVNPGNHTVAVCARGYDAATQKVVLAEGGKATATLKLAANPSATCGAAEPRPAAEVGKLDVSAENPGQVYVDNDAKGVTPLHLEGVAPGVHKVRIVFADGGEQVRTAYVTEGMAARVRFDDSGVMSSDGAFTYRRGLHLGASAGLAAPGLAGGGVTMNAGGAASFFVTFGATPYLDLRADLRLTVGAGSARRGNGCQMTGGGSICGNLSAGAITTLVEVPLTLHFHLGSIYSMVAGLDVGAAITRAGAIDAGLPPLPAATMAAFVMGPAWSVASFRFGARRQFELALPQGISWSVGGGGPWYRQSLMFSYILP